MRKINFEVVLLWSYLMIGSSMQLRYSLNNLFSLSHAWFSLHFVVLNLSKGIFVKKCDPIITVVIMYDNYNYGIKSSFWVLTLLIVNKFWMRPDSTPKWQMFAHVRIGNSVCFRLCPAVTVTGCSYWYIFNLQLSK